MARKPKVYEDDDGRTIADMNVEGMPWYDRSRKARSVSGENKTPMNRSQRQSTIFAVVMAALLIALAFGIGYFLVILLMDTLLR